MKYIFFTVNNFLNDGGNTIRMYGIMNELAIREHQVILISNAKIFTKFNENIKHIHINRLVSIKEKRSIQTLVGIFGYFSARVFVKNLLLHLEKTFNENNLLNQEIISFEYIDNTLGYLLKKMNVISSYKNDLHGIVPLEFQAKALYQKKLKIKVYYMLKYIISEFLDFRVFRNGSGFIYASNEMKEYYTSKYNWLIKKDSQILPYVLYGAESMVVTKYNNPQLMSIKLMRQSGKVIIAFAGSFKILGGVPELIKAFKNITNNYPEANLVLIGDGETYDECQNIVKKKNLRKKVYFIGRIPYYELQSFYSLTDIIVCPDLFNKYSDLIVHAKYYDALLSGKIVITGAFNSISKLNTINNLSEIYNIKKDGELTDMLVKCIEQKDKLLCKYNHNTKFVIDNYQYQTLINSRCLF